MRYLDTQVSSSDSQETVAASSTCLNTACTRIAIKVCIPRMLNHFVIYHISFDERVDLPVKTLSVLCDIFAKI